MQKGGLLFSLNFQVFLISNGVILGLTDYGKTLTHLEIIDSINGESISEIGEEAFYNNQTIVSVVIPEGIVNIGKNAFGKCSKLNSATFVQPKTWYANVNGIERQLSVTVLKNKTQSANYLKQNFNAYSWQRKTQN